jgi:hypothetical protein
MNLALDPGYGNLKLFGPQGGLILPSAVSIRGGERVQTDDRIALRSPAAPGGDGQWRLLRGRRGARLGPPCGEPGPGTAHRLPGTPGALPGRP